MADTTQEQKLFSINDIRRILPEFIEQEYPKETKGAATGTGERGPATLACTMLTIYLLKVAIEKENKKND